MKKRLKVLIAFSALVIGMSSCVYSLFPIYTEDTIVYVPELVGKWKLTDSGDEYVIFEPGFNEDATISISKETQQAPGEPKVVTNFSIDFDDDEYIVIEGDTIRDKEKIKAYYQKELDSTLLRLGETLKKTLEGIGKAMDDLKKQNGAFSFSTEDQSYKMTYVSGDDKFEYTAHLAQIGNDLFLDMFPTDGEHADKTFNSMVWFPVHMFMKLEIEGDQIKLTQFDLDKMNKLFDSNLIRLRHENVDGTVLITAQPKEIQKFLDKYSDDESVFEDESTYSRVVE